MSEEPIVRDYTRARYDHSPTYRADIRACEFAELIDQVGVVRHLDVIEERLRLTAGLLGLVRACVCEGYSNAKSKRTWKLKKHLRRHWFWNQESAASQTIVPPRRAAGSYRARRLPRRFELGPPREAHYDGSFVAPHTVPGLWS